MFFESPWPYQNFRIMTSMSLHKLTGNLKTLTKYVGIDWATALIMTFFPACQSDFSFKPCILAQILSLTWVKWAFFSLYLRKRGALNISHNVELLEHLEII